jgi:nucleoid-associated protein YgaU
VTREHKLALIIGFTLILVVGVLLSDHLSVARNTRFASVVQEDEGAAIAFAETIDPLQQWIKENASREMALAARTAPVPTEPTPAAGITSAPGSQPAPLTTQGESVPSNVETFEPVVIPQGRLASSDDADLGRLGKSLQQAGGTIQRDSSGTPVLTIGLKATPSGQEIAQGGAATTPAPFAAVDPKDVKTYRIQEKDSLYSIAKSQYGDASLWPQLAAFNEGRVGKDGTVRVGATIRIPPKGVLTGRTELPRIEAGRPEPVRTAKAEPKPTPKVSSPASATPSSATPTKSYTVVKGDTLSRIAARQLGSGSRMNEIIAANKGLIDDPDDIRVGMVLKLPAR